MQHNSRSLLITTYSILRFRACMEWIRYPSIHARIMFMSENEIVFVYNADSSIFAVASDFIKKITTPDTYDCQLCMVTYGAISMKNPWREYLDSLECKKTFLHRDEFTKKYPGIDVNLPAILLKKPDELPTVLVSADQINQTKNLQDLIRLVDQAQKMGA